MLFFFFCDWFADQFSEPRGENPCSYAPRKSHSFWSWWNLRFKQANCATCWFVLGIRCSTGFEMKTFSRSEVLANLSHWGTPFSFCFPSCLSHQSKLPPSASPPPLLASLLFFPMSFFFLHVVSNFKIPSLFCPSPPPLQTFLLQAPWKVQLAQIYRSWRWNVDPPPFAISVQCLFPSYQCRWLSEATIPNAVFSRGMSLISFWLMAMACFLSGGEGSWPCQTGISSSRAGDASLFVLFSCTETVIVLCWEE